MVQLTGMSNRDAYCVNQKFKTNDDFKFQSFPVKLHMLF